MLNMSNFKALITKAKKSPATIESLSVSELPQESTVKQSPGKCDTIVNVKYSNLNYKDALVVSGTYPGLKPPMIPGIDLVGTIEESASPNFKVEISEKTRQKFNNVNKYCVTDAV